MQHLTIVTTGGTIDKIYFDDKSQFQIGDPQIGEILTTLGVDFTFEVVPVMRKDSLHMDDQDRALIREAIVRQDAEGDEERYRCHDDRERDDSSSLSRRR